MNNYNISFDDIFSKSYFKIAQQENILKAIRILMPDFEPAYSTTLNRNYRCKLVGEILMESNYESPAKGLLTIKELKGLLETQLQTELAIETQIPSIEPRKENINTDMVR